MFGRAAGHIPTQIGQLTALQAINFGVNELTGMSQLDDWSAQVSKLFRFADSV